MKMLTELFDGLDQSNRSLDTKLCTMCKQTLPANSAYFAKEGSKGYLRYECRNCARKHTKLLNKIKKSAPKVESNHKCPVCQRTGDELTTYGKNKKSVWVADHNHETEEFRGWLCHKCNLGLGNLGDNAERCIRAAEYLSK